MFWHLRQLFLNLFIIYEKHILNYSGGVFKGVFKGVHFQNEKCDCIKYLKLVDPCCGSGSFLVRAMTQALDDCATATEQENVKKHQIFGIEFDENIYGLATTNMLIHSDGNSNIKQGSCFNLADWIKEAKPNIILMNPPYNGQRIHLPKKYVATWTKNKKEDPSKGLYFVKYIADTLNSINHQAKLAVYFLSPVLSEQAEKLLA